MSVTDLPRVAELILSTDLERLSRALEERFTDADLRTPPEGWAARLVDEIRGIEPVESTEYVATAETYLDQDPLRPSILRVATQSALYKIEDLKALYSFNSHYITPYGYELQDWPTILGYRVWVPDCLSEHEAIDLVADIVWEMTFFGNTESAARANTEEIIEDLKRSVDEISSSEPMPVELLDDTDDDSSTDQQYEDRMLKIYMQLAEPLIEQSREGLTKLAELLED